MDTSLNKTFVRYLYANLKSRTSGPFNEPHPLFHCVLEWVIRLYCICMLPVKSPDRLSVHLTIHLVMVVAGISSGMTWHGECISLIGHPIRWIGLFDNYVCVCGAAAAFCPSSTPVFVCIISQLQLNVQPPPQCLAINHTPWLRLVLPLQQWASGGNHDLYTVSRTQLAGGNRLAILVGCRLFNYFQCTTD